MSGVLMNIMRANALVSRTNMRVTMSRLILLPCILATLLAGIIPFISGWGGLEWGTGVYTLEGMRNNTKCQDPLAHYAPYHAQ